MEELFHDFRVPCHQCAQPIRNEKVGMTIRKTGIDNYMFFPPIFPLVKEADMGM